MFSGIVEAQARVISAVDAAAEGAADSEGKLVRIVVERPQEFDDIKTGDSIATNGVCLTVERFDQKTITFALGAETLQITGWSAQSLKDSKVNLERSLKVNDRVHGHMVSGHVDTTGKVVRKIDLGGSVQLDVQASPEVLRYVWKKGSWAVNGVSLTINSVEAGVVSHCLIPETLLRTNLGEIEVGAKVNLEVDMMARGLVTFLENADLEKLRSSRKEA